MTTLGSSLTGTNHFQGVDPADRFPQLITCIRADITYESATQTIGTVPDGAVIMRRTVANQTVWDAITTFEVGVSGNTDAYATTAQSNVTVAGAEVSTIGEVVSGNTDILVTLDQGAATQGAATVIVEYLEKKKND